MGVKSRRGSCVALLDRIGSARPAGIGRGRPK
jgi:hypothetical protein